MSSGGGALASPKISFLPYSGGLLNTLAAGSTTPKVGDTEDFDLSGTNPLATACHDARTSYPTISAFLLGLTATDEFDPIKLKPGETA